MAEASHYFLGRPYTRGSGNLQVGDHVRVHPIKDNHADPYEASIVMHKGNICLDVPDGIFKAPLTNSLFERLERI